MRNTFLKFVSLFVLVFLLAQFQTVVAETVVQTIPVGNSPQRIAALGTKVYTTNFGAGTVTVIDTQNNNATSTVSVGAQPYVLTTLGTKVYVTNISDASVSVIDTSNNNAVSTVSVGSGPGSIFALGSKVYVGNSDNTVSVINTLDNNSVTSVSVGAGPSGFGAIGANLYTVNYTDSTITLIETNNNNATSTISVGSGPFDIAALGNKLYITDFNTNTVSVVDTANNNAVTTITVGNSPWDIMVYNSKVYVANYLDNTVSVINGATDLVTHTVSTGLGPYNMVGLGSKVYVADGSANTLTIIDTANNNATSNVVIGSGAGSIAIVGTRLYTANYNDSTVSVVETDTTAPVITNALATPGETSATITWDTDEESSSIVDFGLTASYATTTVESEISPRVTSHSVLLTSLAACTAYNYRVKSNDAASNLATGSNNTFFTDCAGTAAVTSATSSSITALSGGSLELVSGATGLELTIPAGATGSNAVYQIKTLNQTQLFASIGTPSGVTKAGNYAFDLKALTDTWTTVASFLQPIEITLNYQDSDVTGLDESSLVIYKHNGSSWTALTNCVVDPVSANSITCPTSSFSVFSLFGTVAAAPVATPAAASNSSGGSGIPVIWNNNPATPPGGFKITINSGAGVTTNRLVDVSFNAGPEVNKIAISLTGDFNNISPEDYLPIKHVDLCPKPTGVTTAPVCPDGEYTVYAKFYSQNGGASQTVSQKINLITAAPLAKPAETFTRNLKVGSIDSQNINLQQFLNKNGFTLAKNGAGSPGKETNYFGILTSKALFKFQEANKIKKPELTKEKGYLGPVTRNFINSFAYSAILGESISRPPQLPAPIFQADLYKNMSSKNVRKLQELLATKPDIYPQGLITGYFGLLTEKAVQTFQLNYGIVDSKTDSGFGVVGPKTRAKLQEIFVPG